MSVKFSDHILAAGTHAARPAFGDVPVASLYACSDHKKIYRNTGAAWVDWFSDTVGGGGGGGGGQVVVALVQSGHVAPSGGTSYAGGADEARQFAIHLPAPMYVRALQVKATAAATGTHEWGLFDASVDATAATKLAGGSGSIAAANWNSIAAVGAPVLVAAGAYILVFKWPAANRGTIYYNENGAAAKCSKQITTWVWDDTPDLVTTWATSPSVFNMQLVGDMDASGRAW